MARPSVRTAIRLNAGDFTSIRSAYLRSVSISSSVSEGDHGVGARGANGGDVTGQQRNDDQRERHADEGHQVKGADVKQKGAKSAAAHYAQEQAYAGAHEDELRRAANDEAQDIGALRAQGHADADLMGALHDQERHHAVDPDRSEHERDRGKDADQDDGEFAGRDRIGRDLLERPDICGGQIRVKPTDLAANGGGERARVLRTPHREDHAAVRSLIVREVIFRLWIKIEPAMPHVANQADDGEPLHIRLARIIKGNAFPDDLLIRKPFPGERIVDYDDARAVELVAVVKEAALEDRKS